MPKPRPVLFEPPPWYALALAELGEREIPGDATNPRIAEYFDATQLGPKDPPDETAWCSAFACWCFEQAKIRSTRNTMARSWLTWGQTLPRPIPGCVMIFSREDPRLPKDVGGHVAFYSGTQSDYFLDVLGGNQGNAVTIRGYAKKRHLRSAWPTNVRIPGEKP